MTVTLDDIDTWSPSDIDAVFEACSSNASACRDGSSTLGDLKAFGDWTGEASDTARHATAETANRYDLNAVVSDDVAKAAEHAKGDVEKIKEELEAIRSDASLVGCSIDNATGTVSSVVSDSVVKGGRFLVGNPLVPTPLRSLAAPGQAVLEAAKAAEAKLQQRVNTLLKDAFNVDDDIAVAILAAIGAVPPSFLKNPDANASDILDRRQNQIDAFSKQFGHPPRTPTDFITADALDPHTYSDKTQGAQSEVVVFPIEPRPGQGVIGTRLYIPSKEVLNLSDDPSRILSGQGSPMNLGDDRGTDPYAHAEDSRVSIYVDYENGVVVARQNPTVTSNNSDRPRAAKPEVTVNQSPDGTVNVGYNAVDTFQSDAATMMGVDVEGDIAYAPNPHGEVQVDGEITEYPSAEIYQYGPEGIPTQLVVHDATMDVTGPMFGLPEGPNTPIAN